MNDTHRHSLSHGSAIALCVLLSLLLHLLTVYLLMQLPKREARAGGPARAHAVRHLRMSLRRDSAKEETAKTEPEQKEKAFAKTSADTPQKQPEQADFVGARNTRAASDPTARARNSETDLPAMHGSKERQEDEEIVTFDQARQDGDLSAEGKQAQQPHQAEADNDGDAPVDTPASATSPPTTPRTALTTQPYPTDLFGDLALRPQTDESIPDEEATEQTETTNALPTPPQRARRRCYDPALSAEAQQPGFRTQERKTRSSGRFIFGKGAALNVAATPRGQYEAAIYRRIASFWYAACDEHRGDIIPGQLTISLRLNKQGRLANMQLISRRGASVSQQSFTFAAIRRAALPPMPAEVQQDIVGDLLELIFTFHFD